MKVLVLVFVAVFCLGTASAISEAKMAKLSSRFAALNRLKDNEKKSAELERKSTDVQERGYWWGPPCFGARCDCWDFALLDAYAAELGNLLVTCKTADLWETLDPEKKRENEPFDFYDLVCDALLESAEREQNKTLNHYEAITPCCEFEEELVMFYCMNTYLDLDELKYIQDVFEENGQEFDKAPLIHFLEYHMKDMCDAMFVNPHCLAWNLFGDSGDSEEPDQYKYCFQPEDSGSSEESGSDTEEGTSEDTSGDTSEDTSGDTEEDTGESTGESTGDSSDAGGDGERKRKLSLKEMQAFKTVLSKLMNRGNIGRRR